MTITRVLLFPGARLKVPGGVNFLEQELIRMSRGGFILRQCGVDFLPGLRRRFTLRFLFARASDAEGLEDREYVVERTHLVGKPAGDPMIYSRETADRLNERSRYGFRLVNQMAVIRHWFFVLERKYCQPGPAARYDVIPIERAKFSRTEPWPAGEDREVIGTVVTTTHIFAIVHIPARQPGGRNRTAKIALADMPEPPPSAP